MKKLPSPSRTILFAIIGIMLFFLSAAFGSGAPPQGATPTPIPTLTKADLALEVGSTDGIMIWVVLITLVIIIPILWSWFQEKYTN